MKRALAIETAGRDASVAVVADAVVVDEGCFPGGFRHAAGLLPLVEQMMRRQGWRAADLDAVYVSAGPGSFTGLRVGITVAKALAVVTAVPLVAVPTLSVIVENAPADAAHAVVLLDAKRGQVFAAAFDRVDGAWVDRGPAHLCRLADLLGRTPRPVVLLGEGIESHRPAIPADAIVTDAELWRPRAGGVARLGAAMAAAGRFVDADRLVPTYLRKAEAEEKWDAEHGQPTLPV